MGQMGRWFRVRVQRGKEKEREKLSRLQKKALGEVLSMNSNHLELDSAQHTATALSAQVQGQGKKVIITFAGNGT